MAKNKKFKFYVRPELFFHLTDDSAKARKTRWPARLYFGVENFFYQVGSAVLSVLGKFFRGIAGDIKKTSESLSARFLNLYKNKFYQSLLIFVLVLTVAAGALFGLRFLADVLKLKDRVLFRAQLGTNYLSQAKDSLANKNIGAAESDFVKAYETFSGAQSELAESGEVINLLLGALPQKRAADNLLQAAALVSSAGQDIASLNSGFKNLQVGAFGITAKEGSARESLNLVSQKGSVAILKILQATNLISKVDARVLPKNYQQNFERLKIQLAGTQASLENLKSISELLQNILLDDKLILVFFENNNELRPGGGFMGTYGAFRVQDGFISSMKISSIYDLDGQLLETIKPPQPILNVGYKWYLRDANWFFDFPDTAKIVSDFYEKEAGQTPDVIMVLTPDLITDLLKVTGPIYMPKYGVSLSADNFVEQTQAQTTLSNNLPTNSPKQILADLFPVLIEKISKTEGVNWIKVLEAFQNQLLQKNLVLYGRNENLQKIFNDLNWAGAVAQSDRDYLAIVSANLGGTKTDLAVEQSVKLKTAITTQGTIVNQLEITRKNNSPNLPDTDNLSYIRVFVPKGSRLVANSGFDYKILSFPEDVKYKTLDSVMDWEKNSVTENLTQTRIGQEAGKTFFGNWLNVKAGQKKTVTLTYELPYTLKNIDRYSLLVQKQIGAQPYPLSWSLDYGSRSVEWQDIENAKNNTGQINSDIMVSKDTLMGLVLQK